MSATSVKLLQAAADLVGGTEALARRLGIAERFLEKFLDGSTELPDILLLRAVDIVLSERHAHAPLIARVSEEVAGKFPR